MTEAGDRTADPDRVSELARELRAVRAQAGRSLKELERLTASSDSSLSRYLAGTSIPPWPVVEALCRAAQLDPKQLEPLWQDAQRTRVERRVSSTTTQEKIPAGPAGVHAVEAPPASDARNDGGSDSETPRGPDAVPRRGRRKFALAVSSVGIAAVAAAVLAVVYGGGHHAAASPPAPAGGQVCPWHYVVTDGDPAPVLISDGADPNRKHIGIYEPGQVFYALEPPAKRNGLMQTLDGWVTAGDWIQRYNGPCLNRSDLTVGPTPTR